MVRRLSEFKQKLHPNAKLRAWYASHTFGGTTKAKSLKILGFSKMNFYYIAAGVGALLLIAAVGGGIGVKSSLRSAKVQGAKQGIVGQPVVQSITQERIRTLVSDGQTIVTTETSAYLTTFQRGGGLTEVLTTDENGEKTTVQASLSIITNSEGDIETKTLIGSPVLITHSNEGVSEQTLVFGEPSVVTNDEGEALTTTLFDDVSVTTDENGEVFTSIDVPEPGATATGDNTINPTDAASASDTGGATATDGAPSTVGTINTASTNAATPTSTSVSSSSSSAGAKPSSSSASSSAGGGGGGGGGGGEGGGEEFEGEATFYAPGLGSCGTEATDDDYVAALSKILFDATGSANANNNPYCGRKAFVKAAGGKRRRWDDIGNVTGGVASWEKSRNERWSRRSVLSTGRVSLEGPAPSRNESGNNHEEEYSDNPPMPGITPPPKLEMDLWQRQEGGGGVTITIVDRCPVCKQYDLDLSPAAYNVLGDEDAGRIPIKWKWLD